MNGQSLFSWLPRDVFLTFLEYLDATSRMSLYDAYGESLFRTSRQEQYCLAHDLVNRLLSFHDSYFVHEDPPSGPYTDIYDDRFSFFCRVSQDGQLNTERLRNAPLVTDMVAAKRVAAKVSQHFDGVFKVVHTAIEGGFFWRVYEELEDAALYEKHTDGYFMGRDPTLDGVTMVTTMLDKTIVINMCASGGMVEYRGIY